MSEKMPLRAHVIVRVLMDDGSIEETDIFNVRMDDPNESGLVLRIKEEEPKGSIITLKPVAQRPARQIMTLAIKGELLHAEEEDASTAFYQVRTYPPRPDGAPLPGTPGRGDQTTSATVQRPLHGSARPQRSEGGPGASGSDRQG